MRLFTILVLFVGISFTSCKKYKLKQPAYLTLNWDFFNEDPSGSKIDITGGFFYLGHLKVHGSRAEGPDVEIEQQLPSEQISFSGGGSLGLSIDVPVGDYTDFAVELEVDDQSKPCMVLYGLLNKGGMLIPIRVEWSASQLLTFTPTQLFELKKKENYNLFVGIDVHLLLNGITPQKWGEAIVSMEEGTPTIVVKTNNNHSLFNQIDHNLKTALKLTLK